MEIDETDARYERMDKLGEGTYGIVYKSRDRETGEVSSNKLKRWEKFRKVSECQLRI